MRINTKINLILLIFLIQIILLFWIYFKVESFLTIADIMINRAQLYADWILKGQGAEFCREINERL